ncbi:MAG: PfkB family carbohydrate kinase [Actinobacteria bacterium]|nr:PfkB family carbohydrate kinase [Actinomycetota bacterium]
MSATVWIQGAIAIDTILYLPRFPEAGSFIQSTKTEERPGGTSANVALGLATTGIETGFVGYLGNDENGRTLRKVLDDSDIDRVVITEIDGPTSHVLILVDDKSERTIIGLSPSHLRSLRMDKVPLRAGDIVVFVLWREEFLDDLLRAQKLGCVCVLGTAALDDPRIEKADLVIGSNSDFSSELNIDAQLKRFERIVITHGQEGAIEHNRGGHLSQPTFPAIAVDSTGAGDSFLAGYLAGYAWGSSSEDSLRMGAQWAASAVETPSSIPPDWKSVNEKWSK